MSSGNNTLWKYAAVGKSTNGAAGQWMTTKKKLGTNFP